MCGATSIIILCVKVVVLESWLGVLICSGCFGFIATSTIEIFQTELFILGLLLLLTTVVIILLLLLIVVLVIVIVVPLIVITLIVPVLLLLLLIVVVVIVVIVCHDFEK